FTRHFLYVAPDYFLVWDELSAIEPRQFSWLLNAERAINERAAGDYLLPNGEAALIVERIMPANVSARVEPQMVTTQGRPGEVEKGEQEQRGFQLIERTEGEMKSAEFMHFIRAANSVLVGTAAHSGVPQIEALKGDARGVQINWGHGDTEWILLRGAKAGDEELSTDG